MTLTEMHVWFRQHAQQMGMQNVRAILPEQIDLLINTSISDFVNQIIRENIGATNDRIITDNSKIGQINALRTLYKVYTKENLTKVNTAGKIIEGGFKVGNESFILKLYTQSLNTISTDFNYLFLVDFSINYKLSDNKVTNWYPVRTIDDAYLADTLNDFMMRPRFRTPIAVLFNGGLELYIDDNKDGKLPYDIVPNALRISYIAKPAKVRYKQDIDMDNDEPDIPEQYQIDILKHAVDLYRISISGQLSAAPSAQQTQNTNDNGVQQ